MNELTKYQQPIAPTNFDQAMRLAELMANSQFVPKELQKKPGDCLLVIEQAMRWELSPFAVAQSTSVIHGKLMYEGKLVAAVVNKRLDKSLDFKYEGEGDTRSVTVIGTLPGEVEAREVKVALKDVRTDNKAWKAQPDQQLAYAGSRTWARRHMPEAMLGISSPEEDFTDNRPSLQAATPIASVPVQSAPVEPETGEVSPHQIVTSDPPDWMDFGQKLGAALNNSQSQEELDEWIIKNGPTLENAKNVAPQIHGRLNKTYEKNKGRFTV